MSTHTAHVKWQRNPADTFTDNKYSREHLWKFDGGATVAASPSPSIVPVPYSQPENIDPEEAFVASLSSCHMLFFLSFAAQAGVVVDQYHDHAEGSMAKNAVGKIYMEKVYLNPKITVSGEYPDLNETLSKLHHKAHESCFIANSVITEVIVNP